MIGWSNLIIITVIISIIFSIVPTVCLSDHKVVAFYSGFIIHCESSLRALDRRELTDDAEHERWFFHHIFLPHHPPPPHVDCQHQEHVQHCPGPAR